jgi:hypothetical protein
MGAVGPDGEIDWDCPCLNVRPPIALPAIALDTLHTSTLDITSPSTASCSQV